MMRRMRPLFICGILIPLVFVLFACGSESDISQPVSVDVSEPIAVDGVSISVIAAQLRNSYQTYYLMDYPEPAHTFLELVLHIENLGQSPEITLAWGQENLDLVCGDKELQLAFARRIITNEQVLYTFGEDLDFDYVYIFNVLKDSDFGTCELVFSDGKAVNLASILQIPADFDAPGESLGMVLSGQQNQAQGLLALVAGGSQNVASAYHATIAGGNLNAATASHATVGGGNQNMATDFYATIGGGYANIASARDTAVGGGSRNTAEAPRSTVGGGIQNQALAPNTVIAGGAYNLVDDDYAAICGGTRNVASGYTAFIGGGAGNLASNDQTVVGGGLNNQAQGKYSLIGGGYGNLATGDYAIIPGGFKNRADGSYSFASGRQAVILDDHPGSFLFADGSQVDFPSQAANEFAVRATGGVRLVTAIDTAGEPVAGIQLLPGSGSWSTLSDRSLKTEIEPIDVQEMLELVAGLPISTWRYQQQSESIRHIGPMAQDFYSVFGLGEDPRFINAVDVDGVVLAALQGLYQLVQQQEQELQAQNIQLAVLEDRLQALEQATEIQPKNQPNAFSWLGWFLLLGMITVLGCRGASRGRAR